MWWEFSNLYVGVKLLLVPEKSWKVAKGGTKKEKMMILSEIGICRIQLLGEKLIKFNHMSIAEIIMQIELNCLNLKVQMGRE